MTQHEKVSSVLITEIDQFIADDKYIYVKEFQGGFTEKYRCVAVNESEADLVEIADDTQYASKTYLDEIQRIPIWKYRADLHPEFAI